MPYPLTVHPLTLAYNACVLVLIIAGLVSIKRRPTAWRWLATGSAVGIIGLFLAVFLSPGGFPLIQFACWLLFVHGPLFLLGSAALLYRTPRPAALASAGLAVAIVAIGVDAFVIEPYNLEVSNYVVESPKVAQPTRIVVIADFQTDHIGDYERHAMQTVVDQHADLLLFAGDYLHQDVIDPGVAADFKQLLREVSAAPRLGAYAVRGDVDHAEWEDLFRGTPIETIARSETRPIEGFQLTGLTELDSHSPGRLPSGFTIPQTSDFHIVLAHAPDFALADPPADLMVTGHTHGGQVQLPIIGPLITLSAVPRPWAAGGLVQLPSGHHLAVSRGVGMERSWAPRIRFLCRPQLMVIDLKPL